jgi:EAL domain-containing protein (putative c-di-GMP-specific phosphodiesterase class I)
MIDEDGNTILAGEFIPVAERAGLIKNIDRWVINASFAYCRKKMPTRVFVRLSADSIKDKTLPDWLEGHLNREAYDPSKVCFQIAEPAASQHLRQTKALAARLHRLGFRFAIDHVGGPEHDSTKLMRKMHIDYLKIDGSLMQGLHLNNELQEKVREISVLAGELGIKTIAERVEDANTIAILWQLGISFIQGNYIQMHELVLEDTHSSPGLAIL